MNAWWLCAAGAVRQCAGRVACPAWSSGPPTSLGSLYMRRNLVAFLAGLATLSSVQSAIACSCVAVDPVVAYSKYGIVLLAKVTGLETTPIEGPWNVTLVVLKSWKGPWQSDATIQVQTDGPRGPCGFFIHVGDEMLVYSEDPVNLTGIGLCSTVRGDELPKHIRKLDALSRNAPKSNPD